MYTLSHVLLWAFVSQEHWCQDTEVRYEWVKGHAGDLYLDPKKLERMNIVAD
jgi:hypothetical protein